LSETSFKRAVISALKRTGIGEFKFTMVCYIVSGRKQVFFEKQIPARLLKRA
jgi:hypothetical protein